MAKLLAGARAVVVFAKTLPYKAAWQQVVLKTQRRAQRIEVATVDGVPGHGIIIIAVAIGHGPGDAEAKGIGDDRNVEHPDETAAVIIAQLALDAALECAKLRFCCDQVDDPAGRIPAIEDSLRPTQHLQPLPFEELSFDYAVMDNPAIVKPDRAAGFARGQNRLIHKNTEP